MIAYVPGAWTSFFIAEIGAAAALTGLVIVAMSINIRLIVKDPSISGRAAETAALLTGVLIVSTLGAVPGQPT